MTPVQATAVRAVARLAVIIASRRRARCLYTAARSTASCPRKKRKKKEKKEHLLRGRHLHRRERLTLRPANPHPIRLFYLFCLYASGCACVFARCRAFVAVCPDIYVRYVYAFCARMLPQPLFAGRATLVHNCVALLTSSSHSFKLAPFGYSPFFLRPQSRSSRRGVRSRHDRSLHVRASRMFEAVLLRVCFGDVCRQFFA